MTPYQKEQCEIIRRIAERGRALALNETIGRSVKEPQYVDLFQHITDEIQRLKESDEAT